MSPSSRKVWRPAGKFWRRCRLPASRWPQRQRLNDGRETVAPLGQLVVSARSVGHGLAFATRTSTRQGHREAQCLSSDFDEIRAARPLAIIENRMIFVGASSTSTVSASVDMIRSAVTNQVHGKPVGTTTYWSKPASGNAGSDIGYTVRSGGTLVYTEHYHFISCLQPYGSWKIA